MAKWLDDKCQNIEHNLTKVTQKINNFDHRATLHDKNEIYIEDSKNLSQNIK